MSRIPMFRSTCQPHTLSKSSAIPILPSGFVVMYSHGCVVSAVSLYNFSLFVPHLFTSLRRSSGGKLLRSDKKSCVWSKRFHLHPLNFTLLCLLRLASPYLALLHPASHYLALLSTLLLVIALAMHRPMLPVLPRRNLKHCKQKICKPMTSYPWTFANWNKILTSTTALVALLRLTRSLRIGLSGTGTGLVSDAYII